MIKFKWKVILNLIFSFLGMRKDLDLVKAQILCNSSDSLEVRSIDYKNNLRIYNLPDSLEVRLID